MLKVVQNIEEANCITHSGTFHADDVFASAFLELYLGDVRVFRTNQINMSDVKKDVFVYDVGRGKYDHHQPDAEKRENGITYCSLGLLWRDYGKDFLRKYGIDLVDSVFDKIEKDFIEGIDADDNGVFPKIDAVFKVKTLPGVIKTFNPSYDACQTESEQFEKACAVARIILEEELLYVNGKAMAEEQVLEKLSESSPDIPYLILDKYLPYEEALLASEKANHIFFVTYPSNRGGYAIKTVPKSMEDKTARKEFPVEWAGLEGEELEKVSGISGLVFCHSTRFLVSCRTLEAVYKVLERVL